MKVKHLKNGSVLLTPEEGMLLKDTRSGRTYGSANVEEEEVQYFVEVAS